MTAIENYFKTRYIQRLDEFRLDIREICERELTGEKYHEDFLLRYNQFTSTNRMHIIGLEKQNVSHCDSDLKFTKFMSKEWLLGFLSHSNETSEILSA